MFLFGFPMNNIISHTEETFEYGYKKEINTYTKETCVHTKETYVHTKETHVHTKETYPHSNIIKKKMHLFFCVHIDRKKPPPPGEFPIYYVP